MDSDFATYEQSLILKELGFDKPCLGYFYKEKFHTCDIYETGDGSGFVPFYTQFNMENEDIIARPLFQQAFAWINLEIRKYKRNFEIEKTQFFVNFESPQESLDKYINILLKIKESEELEEEEEESIVTGEDIKEASVMEKLKVRVDVIKDLKTKLEKSQSEVSNLRGKVKTFTKNISELKDLKSKIKSENIKLSEDLERIENLNKKNASELQKVKTTLISVTHKKDKLESDNLSNEKRVDSLQNLVKNLESKIESLENKITKLHVNYSDELLVEFTKVKKFLWLFDVNKKKKIWILQQLKRYLNIAIERGSEEAKEKWKAIEENPKINKYLK